MKMPDKAVLCYMNIKKGQFHNVDLNFDMRYRFQVKVTKTRTRTQAVLSVEKYDNLYVDGFFGENISAVNVLVGKNGSGKTSILHSVILNIRKGLTAMNGEGIVYIINVDGKYVLEHNYSNLEIDETSVNDTGIEIMSDNDYFAPFRQSQDYTGGFRNNHFWRNIVFYSNHFGSRYSTNDYDYIIDISKDKEISRILKELIETETVYDNPSIQYSYHKLQYKKILNYIDDRDFRQLAEQLSVVLPELIRFSWNKERFTEVISSLPGLQENVSKFQEEYWINHKRFRKHLNEFGIYINESRSMYESAINRFSIFLVYQLYVDKMISEETVNGFINDLSETEELTGSEILYEILGGLDKERNKFDDLIELLTMLNNQENWWVLYWQDKDSFLIKWEDEDLRILRKQFAIENIYFYNCELVSSEGRGAYSAGEESRINFLISMYDAVQQVNKSQERSKNVLLLLDEIDAYYHPQFQIGMVDEILRIISLVFREYQVQLIFTSNTPLELSDIPHHNITYLDKGAVLEEVADLTTFGGNVCTLLKNNFFINSTMGMFAKKKINYTIEFLKNPETAQISKDEVKYIISIIAEPIIKEKLEKWYYERYPEEISNIEQKEELYRKKIQDLENYIRNSKSVDEAMLDKLKNELEELTLLIDDIKKV